MKPSTPRTKPTTVSQHQVLDPRSLGRPVHLLEDFAAAWRERLDDLFRQALNRRYRASYSLLELSIEPPGTQLPAGAWQSIEPLDAAHGRLACLLDRSFVLSVMSYRYGGAADQLSEPLAQAQTATEERLCGFLGQQLLQGLATRLLGGDEETAATGFTPARGQAPAADSWLVRVPLREGPMALATTLYFTIDAPWMNRLLREREAPRNKPAKPLPQPRELAHKLQLQLVARLLETELPLSDLLELRPGSVIPVSLKSTEVMVDGSRLFSASVAEHQGKLCLTSFADVE